MSEPPFKKGDLLCLTGPSVMHGRYIHRADDPILRRGIWWNGYQPWGNGYTAPATRPNTLRHAKQDDVLHLLKIEAADLVRAAERIELLHAYLEELQDE